MDIPFPRAARYLKHAAEALRMDTWANVFTGLGGGRDRTKATCVQPLVPLTFQELEWMYHGHDLAATIVDRLPTDALSGGWSYGAADLDDQAERWGLPRLLKEARIWGRLHGVAAILIGTSDRLGYPDQKLDPTKVGKGDLEFLEIIDRQDLGVCEYDADPQSPTYNEPLMYQIAGHNVHPSRLVIFGGALTSPSMRTRTGGFDLSVLQRPNQVLIDADQTWRAVMNLLLDMSQAVISIKGLMEMIANGQKDVVLSRMQVVDMARSMRMVVLDADGEDFKHVGAANVTGVDPLVVRTFQRLASAARMPLSILMGMSASGLNATGAGESDLKIWTLEVSAERAVLEPAALFLGYLVAKSEGLEAPTDVEWPSTWQPTETEAANLDKVKADTASVRIAAQITTYDEEARVLAGEPLADVLADRALLPAPLDAPEDVEAADAVDAKIAIKPGSTWIDTTDGHRSEVKSVGLGRVYYVDLDGENPARQWSLSRRAFLDRSQHRSDPDEAEPTAPAPDQSE